MTNWFKYLLFLLPFYLLGCFDNPADNPIGNKPPDTFLYLYPDSVLSQQPSRVYVSWTGDDPDGTILGFYFKWEGIDTAWNFTIKNDSTFSLSIGTTDTSYNFLVTAVDNNGNSTYDDNIFRNGIYYGREPFIDQDGDNMYDEGEIYYDIGLIDPSPAILTFPIKNSPPEIMWSALSALPNASFPVMTFGWDVSDLDGEATIVKINVSLNDTNSFVSLPGSTRLITIRCPDINALNPEMEILLNGSEQNIHSVRLQGISLDEYNRIYIQAEDISGAKSPFAYLPDTSKTWFVKKPKGKLLIIDNYAGSQVSADFYQQTFSSLGNGILLNKFDAYDIQSDPLPFENITFVETIKLFDYLFWYSSSQARLDLLSLCTNKYIDNGGKIAFSLTFEDSSTVYSFDLQTLQTFLPVDSLGQKKAVGFLLKDAELIPSDENPSYPVLKTSTTVSFARTYFPNPLASEKVYRIQSNQLNGNIALISNSRDLFFIGMPLHLSDSNGNVKNLLEKIFFEEFGLVP